MVLEARFNNDPRFRLNEEFVEDEEDAQSEGCASKVSHLCL